MRRFSLFLLILILLFSLAACSRKTAPAAVSAPYIAAEPENTAEPTEATVITSPEPEESPEEEDEPEQGQDGGLYVTDVYIVELEDGQAFGGG